MESIYQKDLMELLWSLTCHFFFKTQVILHTSFLDKVVPILKEREWEVNSNTEEFVLSDIPLDIDFGLNSSGENWFSFQSHAEIDGAFRAIKRTLLD